MAQEEPKVILLVKSQMKRVDKYNLSYVLTTRNKLPYLKEVMTRLIENVQDDEEIVVVDGASTDGSVEYLKNQFEKGHIHSPWHSQTT